MQKYWNTVQDEHGNPRYGASVAVQQSSANVTIYTDAAGLIPATNPLTTDSTRGYFEFYAPDGIYDLTVTGVGFASYTITGILLFDPADHSGTPVSTTGLIGQSLAILVGDYTQHSSPGTTLNEFGSVFEITGGSGTQSISRVALNAAAQTGGGGSNQVEAANFVVQLNAADTNTSMVGLEIDVNNNKADDALNPAANVSHYGLAVISGGAHKVGPAAVFISNSSPGINDFQRGIYISTGSVASGGFAFDYAGPGTGGVFQVNANGSAGIGTTALANAAVAVGQVGTILTGVSQYSVFESGVASSGATSLYAAFSAQPQTVASAFTCTSVEGYRVENAVKGAGSSITTLTGFNVQPLTSGTTNRAFRGQVASGANNYNLYLDGTAQNYIAGLLDISPSTAGQIKFPSTQNASSDANTLDDYQEGVSTLSWTPVITFATVGDLAVTYATRVGTYIKIGRLVIASFNLVTSAFTYTTSVGNFQITGLPYAALNLAGGNNRCAITFGGITKAGYSSISAVTAANSTSLTFSASGSAVAPATLAVADVPSGGTVVLVGTLIYIANA